LIVDGENEFDQDVLTFDNNFKTKYEQLFKMYNGGHCAMVLIKNQWVPMTFGHCEVPRFL
jgi:hypothetical protein